MGVYLSRSLRWENADSLEATPANEDAYKAIFKILKAMCEHEMSYAMLEFASPIQWESSLSTSTFVGPAAYSDDGILEIKEGVGVYSREKTASGTSIYSLEAFHPTSDKKTVWIAKIACFKALVDHMQCSNNSFKTEAKRLLEGNKEIWETITGCAGKPDDIALQLLESMLGNLASGKLTVNDMNMESDKVKLSAMMCKVDLRLLSHAQSVLEHKLPVLTQQVVDIEVKVLQSMCGSGNKAALRSIRHESDFNFAATGARAPPWRYVHGELCYVQVTTVDVGSFIITCAKQGCFRNGGYFIDQQGEEKLNYARVGNTHGTLAACLKEHSPFFADKVAYHEHLQTVPTGRKSGGGASSSPSPAGHHSLGDAVGGRVSYEDHHQHEIEDASTPAPPHSVGPRAQSPATSPSAARRPTRSISLMQHSDRQSSDRSLHRTRSRNVSYETQVESPRSGSRVGGSPIPMSPSPSQQSGPPPSLSKHWSMLIRDDLNGSGHSSTHSYSHTHTPPSAGQVSSGGGSGSGNKNRLQKSTSHATPPSGRVASNKASLRQRSVSQMSSRSGGKKSHSRSPSVQRLSGLDRERERERERSTTRASFVYDSEDDSVVSEEKMSDSSDEDTSEDEWKDTYARKASQDMSIEEVQIQKLVKVLKTGNPSMVVVAVVSLAEHDYATEKHRQALHRADAVPALLALLECEDEKMKNMSCEILKRASESSLIQEDIIANAGVVKLLNVFEQNEGILAECVGHVLYQCCTDRTVRRSIRQCGGIRRIVHRISWASAGGGKGAEGREHVILGGLTALRSALASEKNRMATRNAGGMDALIPAKNVGTKEVQIALADVMGMLALDRRSLAKMVTGGLVHSYSKVLTMSKDTSLVLSILRAMQNFAKDPICREQSAENGVMAVVTECSKSDELGVAALKASEELVGFEANLRLFLAGGGLASVLKYLESTLDSDAEMACAVLCSICKHESGRKAAMASGCTGSLIKLLSKSSTRVVVSSCHAIHMMTLEPAAARQFAEMDGIRICWTHLKNPSADIQAASALALIPCLSQEKTIQDVQSFVGGISLLVSLLDSPSPAVRASVAGCIARIGVLEHNTVIMTELAVVPKLAAIVSAAVLISEQHYVCEAIAEIASFGSNAARLGELGTVAHVCHLLHSKDRGVQASAIKAAASLSFHKENAHAFRTYNAVQRLVQLMKMHSDESDCQDPCATAITNIRRFHIDS
jgi:hypothetical protein